jgi:FMN phosphatase YigB (HAD superfamily)
MKIVFDCDEVILDTTPAIRQCYLADVDKSAEIPTGCYPSTWDVWGQHGTNDARQKWLNHIKYFTTSEYFTKIDPVPGSIDVTRNLRRDGHDLYVLSAIGSDSGKARKHYIEKVFGHGVFSDVICIDPMDSKKEVLQQLKAQVLVDDGATNISDALELGIHGIWKSCPENSEMIRAILFGKEDVSLSYWRANQKLVAKKAIIAKNWHDIERIIINLSIMQSQHR